MNDEIRKQFERLYQEQRELISKMTIQELRAYKQTLVDLAIELHKKLKELGDYINE